MKALFTIIFLFEICDASARSQAPLPHYYEVDSNHVIGAIVQAFADSGTPIAEAQVSLTAHSVATEPNPVLNVVSTEILTRTMASYSNETKLKVRVVCNTPNTCIPFYVLVTLPEGKHLERLRAESSEKINRHDIKTMQSVISRGAHPLMLLEDDRAAIELQVLSLEDGVIGQMIRVASLDHQHIYLVQVVSATVVKGRF